MPLNTPASALEIEAQIKTDIQQELADSNPFLKNSYFGGMATGQANRLFDFYIQLQLLQRSLFIDSASSADLDRALNPWVGPRNAASAAAGNVAMTGAALSSIPSATVVTSDNGFLYTSTEAVVVGDQTFSVLSLSQSGGVATCITSVDHGLASNVGVTISGADQTEYNGLKAISVTGLNRFSFAVDSLAVSPATGTIDADATFASVPVECNDVGSATNLPEFSVVSLQSPIVGVDNDGQVDFGTLGGGSESEADQDYRTRGLRDLQNPLAHFNSSDIEKQAKTVEGVTRVFVLETTPDLGQVTIYFTRDNDADPIPDGSEVAEVKDAILEIKPANTSDSSVIVLAPTAQPTDFTFSQLVPNTLTMQSAIVASLEQFFDEEVSVGVNVDRDLYRAAIANTVDTATGDSVQSFELSAPTGDLPMSSGDLPTLGAVNF